MVVYALELSFDHALDERIRALWATLSREGIPSLTTQGHRRSAPHVSVAVGADLGDVDAESVASLPAPHLVHFGSVALFAGEGGVLFLAARPSARLLEYHRALHAALPPSVRHQVWEHYRPGRLTPHCTLAEGVPPPAWGSALQLVQPQLPLAGSYAGLNLVDIGTGEARRLCAF